MKKILIIHPEGNFNYNPNLSSILELFLQQEYLIDILCQEYININQEIRSEFVSIFFYNHFIEINKNIPIDFTKELEYLDFKSYHLIIAIDLGVVLAYKISIIYKIPYALISFEIFFKDEKLTHSKELEIQACSRVSFVIATDIIRGLILSSENKISISKIFFVPISSPYKGPYSKSNFLRKKFNISCEKKIAIHIGSFSDWTMDEEIIQQSRLWGDEWVLILHGRYGINSKLQARLKGRRNIYLNTEKYNKVENLSELLLSADIGIALYKPVFRTQYDGKNLLHLGLSSGKISQYLQYGLPIMVNEIGLSSYLIEKYNCGKIIRNKHDINPSIFNNKELEMLSNNATKLFRDKIDFTLHMEKILNLIELAISGTKITNLNKIEFNDIFLSQIMQINSLGLSISSLENKNKYRISRNLNSLFNVLSFRRLYNKFLV